MIQIREVVLVLRIFKSGNFFLAHPVDVMKHLVICCFYLQLFDESEKRLVLNKKT